MAVLDRERGVVLLRVAYDGPPFSGKTTTVRSLAEGLGVEVITPGEANGRTLFFDYADYVGGLFEGCRIRCQIVSVPGQAVLRERRLALLDDADVIVFVGDMRAPVAEKSFALLEQVLDDYSERDPPVGVVLQANKRDHPTSMPVHQIRERLSRFATVAVKESVATTGDGVRETFVFAVRLGLDRVRALGDLGQLGTDVSRVWGADELLASLTDLSGDGERESVRPTWNAPGAVPPVEEEPEVRPHPFRPDPAMPGGLLWPPVEGRVMLHEVHDLELVAHEAENGDWCASGAGWRFHSACDDVFRNADEGRAALIEWARTHAVMTNELSAGRVLLLGDVGDGRHRLWQLVRNHPSLADRLTELGAGEELPSAKMVADRLCELAELLVEGVERWAARRARPLPCNRWTLGRASDGNATFVGLMPGPLRPPERSNDGAQAIRRELEALTLMGVALTECDVDAVAVHVERRASASPSLAIDLLREALDDASLFD